MKSKLNLKQKLFCKYYATDREFFGNGVESYVAAYNPKHKGNWYNSARTLAYELLTNIDILNEINSLLEGDGLNDSFVDKQLKMLLTQNADLRTKLGAISEYNKLKVRIIKKIEADVKVEIPEPIYGGKSTKSTKSTK